MFRHIPLKNFVRSSRFPGNTLISIKLHFSVGKPTCQQFRLSPPTEPSWLQRGASQTVEPVVHAQAVGSPQAALCPPGVTHWDRAMSILSCAGEDLGVLLIAVKPWRKFPSSQEMIRHPRSSPSPRIPRDLRGEMVLESIHAWNGQE